jgi:hypothetical protein
MPLSHPATFAIFVGASLFTLPMARAEEAPEAPRRHVKAARVKPGSIQVDGKPDDPGWQDAPWYEGFVQSDPDEGKPATEPTRFKIATDESSIYVLVEAFDSQPDQMRALLSRRDVSSSSEWIHVLFDTAGDHRTAYRFQVNPVGVRIDSRIGADNVEDTNWDAVWEARAVVFDKGWRVEMAIPLNQLRWPSGVATWGIQVARQLQRRAEIDVFNPMPRNEVYLPRRFGILEISDLPTPWRVELSPYGSGGVSGDSGAWSLAWNLGLDGRVGLGPTFTLDFTINPDFGQVEADPSQLNLTTYETYFSEKRPFFLEGADMFRWALDTGLFDNGNETLFYSRRVGRTPQRDPSDYGDVVQSPDRSSILGALKLTGKTSGGWTVGLLEAVTQAEFADVDESDGRHRLLVEPLTEMAVLRVARDFREGQTQVGLLLTDTTRHMVVDSASFFPAQANTAGVDVDHRVGDYELVLKLYGSWLHGSAGSLDRVQRSEDHFMQRPDADMGYDPERHDLTGWGTLIEAAKFTGTKWHGAVILWTRSPGLDVNDLGYEPAVDDQSAQLWFQLRDDEPSRFYKSIRLNMSVWADRSFEGDFTGLHTNANGFWVFPETSYAYAGAHYRMKAVDTRVLWGGPALKVPGMLSAYGGFGTDDRKKWSVGVDASGYYQEDRAGWDFWIGPWLTVRPYSSVEITLIPSYEHQRSGYQFATDLEDENSHAYEWFVGDLSRDTLSATLRVSWSLTADLSLQWYAMPYLTVGTYADFYEVTAPRADRYSDRFTHVSKSWASQALGLSDRFLWAQVRSNLVLRWEFRAGSTIYLVWSHQQTDDRSDTGALSWPNTGHLFRQPSQDVVMAKLAWWWSK